jgi:hypothetical protein
MGLLVNTNVLKKHTVPIFRAEALKTNTDKKNYKRQNIYNILVG